MTFYPFCFFRSKTQHLGLLEQLENVGNMSNGTSGATEDLEQQINSFYFYEVGTVIHVTRMGNGMVL